MRLADYQILTGKHLVDVYDLGVADTHLYGVQVGDVALLVSNSKRVSMLDVNALLSHGAHESLKGLSIRGHRNDRFWLNFMNGFTPPDPREPLTYEKFLNQLRGAGINPVRRGHQLHIMALTDKDIDGLAGDRKIRNGETVQFDKDLKPIAGGLFDPQLTGGHHGKLWSSIPLPEPMPSPVFEEPIRRVLDLTQKKYEAVLAGQEELPDFGKGPQAIKKALESLNLPKEIAKCRAQWTSGKATYRDKAVRKWGYLADAQRLGIHPKDWMLSKVPVLPPQFRPVSVMGGRGTPLVSDSNYLYKELVTAGDNLKQMKELVGENNIGDERLALYNAFKAVTGLGEPVHPKLQEKGVKGLLQSVFGSSPKFGSMQRRLLSSAADNVGRAVVVPDPDLDMDSIGLPESTAYDVYGRFLVRAMRRRGMPLRDAIRHVKDKTELARSTLMEEMKVRPVYMNRAPVLHKFGIMAFKPRLMTGDSMHVSPLVTKGMGMDFDGDQQINRVFLALPKGLAADSNTEGYKFSVFFRECAMPFSSRLSLPAVADHDLFCIDLCEFPHGNRTETSKGQFGKIDWYSAVPGIKVLTHDAKSGELRWCPVTAWSVHHGCPVTLVNLKSGRQLITDDDPRAVYGMKPGTLEMGRARPAEAIGFMVPRLRRLWATPTQNILTEIDTTKWFNASHKLHLQKKFPLTAETGYLLGVAAGDGWVIASGKDFCVAGITNEIIAKVDSVIATLFHGDSPQPCTQVNFDSYGSSRRTTWTSQHLGALIADMIGQGAENKQLPPFFLSTSAEFRSGLLSGIMDTDGSISVSRAKAKPQLMGNISSCSLRLLHACGLLMWSLGIQSRITTSKTPAGLPFWVLSICNADLKSWGAPYMVHPAKLTTLDSIEVYESGVSARQDLVPISATLAAAMCKAIPTPKDHTKMPPGAATTYSAIAKGKKFGFLTRFTSKQALVLMPEGFSHPDFARWQQLVADTQVTWDAVESYEDTGIVETGYDLTVPGPETFLSADGVFLSNTAQFHVPTSDKEVEEAYARMLPSKSLLSPADFKTPVAMPGQEYLSGLHFGSTARDDKKKPRVFRNEHDAEMAWKRHEITADTPVHIIEHK